MSNQKTSPLATARQRVHDIYANQAYPIPSAVIERARAETTSAERAAVEEYGWDRVFGEVERQRNKSDGLRRGERTVTHTGEQTSLPLLGMTVPQARASNAGKHAHAAGALAEAEFERMVIDIVEERMRERGIDPLLTEMVLGSFIDSDEIAELRRNESKAA